MSGAGNGSYSFAEITFSIMTKIILRRNKVMENYYSKIRKLEKELERNQKIYDKLCRQREILNNRKGVVMLTECMDLEIKLISVSITISSISEQLRYLHEEYKKYKEENSREFYDPMDNVDIIMLIHKDGSIHGTIL